MARGNLVPKKQEFMHPILQTGFWGELTNPSSKLQKHLQLERVGEIVVSNQVAAIHFKTGSRTVTPEQLKTEVEAILKKDLVFACAGSHTTENEWQYFGPHGEIKVRRSFAKPGWHLSVDITGDEKDLAKRKEKAQSLAERLKKDLAGKIDFRIRK